MIPRGEMILATGVSEALLRYHARQGRIPMGHRIGGRYFYTEIEAQLVLKFFRSRERYEHSERIEEPKIDLCNNWDMNCEIFIHSGNGGQ